MKIGLVLPLTEPAALAELAQAAEQRGFESVFIGEHTHMPTQTVHAYTSDTGAHEKGYVPDFYRRFPDPYISLAAAASVTRTIRLGTCVALPAEHNPLILAKTVSTLDKVSSGRVVFGVGYGWNKPEMENNGVSYEARHAVFRENVMAMRALWTEEVAAFSGDHVSFTESWSYPKPVQDPLPVLLGAKLTPRAIRHIVEFCDGCIPVQVFEEGRLKEDLSALRRAFQDAGRDSAGLDVTIINVEGSMGGKRSQERFDSVFPADSWFEEMSAAEVTRVAFGVPLTSRDLAYYAMDRYAKFLV